MPETPTLAVLHGVRLASVVGTEALRDRTGLPAAVVESTVERCEQQGWLRRHRGHLEGYALTREGREHGERLLAEELDGCGARDELEAAYREFLPLNGAVLRVCTDWQVVRVEGVEVPNDHSDEAHDLAVLGRLRRVHGSARPLLRRLVGSLDRFGGYEARLELALRRSLAGGTEWLTRPTIDSYHTVWFELHEDLLATLGRRRSDEERGAGEVRGAGRSHTDGTPSHIEELT